MKELFQAIEIEKCIAFGKRVTAFLIICSMLMIDVAKAMDDQDDPRLLKVVQRTPSPKPPAPDLRSMGSPSPEQSSSDGDSSPRSVSPPSSLPAPARDIIGSKPSSDDSVSSGSSPEQSPPNGNQSLQIIPFPDLSQSSRQNITSPSSSSRESQPEDFGTTPGAASFPDRVPALHVPSEKDRLLGSRTSSYGSSHSSGSSDHSNENSTDSEEDGVGEVGHPQSSETAFGRFIKKFASTQSSQSPDQKGTPGGIALRDNEILENGGTFPLLNPDDTSIQSQGPGDGELRVDIDLDGDENAPPAPRSRFLPAWVSEWLSDRPFWPEKPTYRLSNGGEAEDLRIVELAKTYFLDPLRSRQAHTSSVASSDTNKGPSVASRFLAFLRNKYSPESDERKDRSSSFSASSDSSSSDLSPHGLSASQQYVEPHPDSESEGDGQTVTLLPPDHLHRTMNYSSLRGMFHPSGVSGTLHQDHDEEFDPTAVVPYPGSLPPQTPWALLLDDIIDLAVKIKVRLKETYKDLNGDITWIDCVAVLIASVVAWYYANGMGAVYIGGIAYLGNLNEAFNEFVNENAASYLVLYIMYSALPDSLSRNAHLWKKAITYLFQEKKEIGRMFVAGGIAAITALIPVAYLIFSENVGRERLNLPNWDNEFGRAVAIWGPFLYLDAFANDLSIALNSISNLEDGFRQFRQVFFPSSLSPQIRSPEEIQTANQREKFDGDLLKLKHFLVGASDTVIEAIYQDLQDVIAGARSEEDLAAQKTFAAVSYLLSLGDEVQEVAKKYAKESIVELAFEGLKYLGLIFGAPTTALLLQLVGSTVASLFTSNVVADSIGEGFSLVAFLPFSYVLFQYLDNFKNLVFSKDPRGHESHPGIRLPVKIFIGLQSLVYLFQTSIAVLQSYNKWFGDKWWPFAAGIPFFIPKLMGLVYNFNGTFNEQITTSAIKVCHRIGSRCRGKSLCKPCRKGELISDIESIRSNLEHWDPVLIHNLTKGVEIFKN